MPGLGHGFVSSIVNQVTSNMVLLASGNKIKDAMAYGVDGKGVGGKGTGSSGRPKVAESTFAAPGGGGGGSGSSSTTVQPKVTLPKPSLPPVPAPPKPPLSTKLANSVNSSGTQSSVLNNTLTTNTNQLNHMFADRSGHFTHNTAVNRSLITSTANNPNKFMGEDSFGVQWFAHTQADGTQVWAKVKNNIITEAGINQVPHNFDQITGLNAPRRR